MPQRCTSAFLLSCLLALLSAMPAIAQAPAQLAPADTQVFIHMDSPAQWFGALTDGPIGERVRKQIETDSSFGDILALLDMDFDQFLQAYFGGQVVVIGPDANNENSPGLIFTQVSKDNRDRAIDSFELKHVGEIGGAGMFASADGSGLFVMSDEWVTICGIESVEYLHAVLERDPIAPTLADTEAYAYWTGLLPADRTMTALFLGGETGNHAFGITRNGKQLDVTYAGKSPDSDDLMLMLGETDTADFGPLPTQTLAAISFNFKADPDQQPNELIDGLNMIASPSSFTNDVLPKLDSPTLLFIGSVTGEQVELDVDLPVFGLAMKMKDRTAATDLQFMMDRLVLLANLATAEWQAGPVPFRMVQHGGAQMRVAEIGKPVAKYAEWPELEPMQLVYGAVGDYYIICTQEQFFKQCVDANAGDKTLRIGVEGPAHPKAVAPIMAISARPDAIGQLLRTWLPLVEGGDLPADVELDIQAPRMLTEIEDFAQLLEQYSVFKLQLWRGEDGLLIGHGQLAPPF